MSVVPGCDWAALASFDHIEMRPGGREEVLDGVVEEFPYLAVLSQHDRYHERTVPWHWHQEVELFYVLSGTVLYATPHERLELGPGAAGFVNANVLHMTRAVDGRPGVDLLIHEFRPRLIAEPRSLLWSRYVEPLTSTTSIELFATGPDDSATRGLRETLRSSFDVVEEGAPGWELRVRDAISEVWLGFVELLGPRLAEGPAQMPSARDERLRAMLDFVGAHYPERIGVRDVAAAAFASERECHRTFREALGVTPAQYLRDYRIEQACRMLAHTTRPVAAVAELTGLGSASHFGQTFRAAMGCTPSEYRHRWQNSDTRRQQTS